MSVPPSVSVGDLEFAFYKAAVPAADNSLAVTLGQGIVSSSAQASGKYSSQSNTGAVTTPAAGSGIASLTPGTAGYYQIDCVVGFAGTAETTAVDNFELYLNGSPASGLAKIPCVNVANTMSPKVTYFRSLTATDVLAIANPAIGSTNSVYKATIIAIRIA